MKEKITTLNYKRLTLLEKSPYFIAISSGKGGVGKTLTSINCAMASSRLGLKVLLFDGDLGMANIDVLLGLDVKFTLKDVLEETCTWEDLLITGPEGIKILPSGSGIKSLQNLSLMQKNSIRNQMRLMQNQFDLILFDTGAGINENVLNLNEMAHKSIVVTTSEPHAITDAYGLTKVLSEERGIKDVSLIVNMVKTESEAHQVANRFTQTCAKFLGVKVNFLGWVPQDPTLSQKIMTRRLQPKELVRSISGQAWNKITLEAISTNTGLKNLPQKNISLDELCN